jgi:hypothetical protein
MRKIFELMRDEMTGGFRKLRSEELRNLYSLPRIIRMINHGGCNGQGMHQKWAEEEFM